MVIIIKTFKTKNIWTSCSIYEGRLFTGTTFCKIHWKTYFINIYENFSIIRKLGTYHAYRIILLNIGDDS